MSAPKLPTRNVVPARRAVVDNGLTAPRTRPGPTQPFTDAQRSILLEDMREPAPAPGVALDDELELEIQIGVDEAAAPAKKTASTNAHVARRPTK